MNTENKANIIIRPFLKSSTILFIMFFLLKIGIGDTLVQEWSWWLVTLPLWFGLALLAVICLATLFVCFIIAVFTK